MMIYISNSSRIVLSKGKKKGDKIWVGQHVSILSGAFIKHVWGFLVSDEQFEYSADDYQDQNTGL